MARAAGPTVALDGGFEHGDGGEARHGRFAGRAAVRCEPADVMAERVLADFGPAVIALMVSQRAIPSPWGSAKKASTSACIAGRLSLSANRSSSPPRATPPATRSCRISCVAGLLLLPFVVS